MFVAIIVNFIIIGSVIGKVKDQTAAGVEAKRRQCLITPVSNKLYSGAAQYNIISQQDLITFLSTQPRDCKKVLHGSH